LFKWSKFFVSAESIETYEKLDGAKILDAHCHIGNDLDGHSMSQGLLVQKLDECGVEKAVIFPFNDREKQNCFEIANDRVLRAWREYPERLIPFFRLDPNSPQWPEEFDKRVSQGFRGLKLHPRAQKFDLSSAGARRIFERAEEADIPIIIHTGFGLEDSMSGLLGSIREHPDLRVILGHSGFVDIGSVIDFALNNRNVYFDTSVVRMYDLFFLMQRMDHARIFYGSDTPYGGMDFNLQGILSVAISLGFGSKEIEAIIGGNLERFLG